MPLSDAQAKQFTVVLGQMNSFLQELAMRRRKLVPYAEEIIGPNIGTIPDAVKSFNIINLGKFGLNLEFAIIGVSGIPGMPLMPINIRVFGYSIENDQDEIVGPIIVQPWPDHHVILQYLK